MIRGQVNTGSACPVTVFFADSLGSFRYWVTQDTLTNLPGQIRLRVLQLSPDAGQVFFTVNKRIATAFPDSLQYGSVTPFINLDNPVSDTLTIRFYHVGDTTNILTRAFLYADPGRVYTMVLKGYVNSQAYPDPKTPGNTVNINPDLSVVINKNY